MISVTTYFLLSVTLVALILILVDYIRSRKAPKRLYDCDESSALPDPPGPKPWPVLGSLHILGRYDVPYKAFADLVSTYNSQVIKLKMGSLLCVVVNGLENIKEVLITKGQHFDSRPNFVRYHLLFCGNKENCKKLPFASYLSYPFVCPSLPSAFENFGNRYAKLFPIDATFCEFGTLHRVKLIHEDY